MAETHLLSWDQVVRNLKCVSVAKNQGIGRTVLSEGFGGDCFPAFSSF